MKHMVTDIAFVLRYVIKSEKQNDQLRKVVLTNLRVSQHHSLQPSVPSPLVFHVPLLNSNQTVEVLQSI